MNRITLLVLLLLTTAFVFLNQANCYAENYILKEEHEVQLLKEAEGSPKQHFIIRVYLENYGDEQISDLSDYSFGISPEGSGKGVTFAIKGPLPKGIVGPHSRVLIQEHSFPIAIIYRIPDLTGASSVAESSSLDYYVEAGMKYNLDVRINATTVVSIYDTIIVPLPNDDHILAKLKGIGAELDSIKNIIEEFRSHFEYRFNQIYAMLKNIYNAVVKQPIILQRNR